MATKKNYGQSIARLEEIVGQIERDELDIDSLGDAVKEAQELIRSCREKLTRTDEQIKKLLEDPQ